MKHTTLIGALALVLGLSGAAPAFAHTGHERIDQRQERQARRIEHGIDNGSLTHREAKKLRKQQRRIRKLERKMRADGHLEKRERRTLQSRLDQASDRIYRLKHNDHRDHSHRERYWDDDRWPSRWSWSYSWRD